MYVHTTYRTTREANESNTGAAFELPQSTYPSVVVLENNHVLSEIAAVTRGSPWVTLISSCGHLR